jgi:DNA-binding protein Fis
LEGVVLALSVLDALDRPIAFHRVFVELTGSVTAALMLSQIVYWSKRTSDDKGWFYKTREEWAEETGMLRREQETARKALRKHGFLEEKRVGVPAKLHYRLKWQNLQTRLHETYQLDGTNPPNWMGGNVPSLIAETTTETTTEIKAELLKASVRRLFTYYIEQTGKNPKLYTLTDNRMKKGLSRLGDCLQKTGGKLDKAEEMMGMCIDELASSDFHMGKNENNRQYVDWIDHLFKSTEKLEWWMNR